MEIYHMFFVLNTYTYTIMFIVVDFFSECNRSLEDFDAIKNMESVQLAINSYVDVLFDRNRAYFCSEPKRGKFLDIISQ